MNIQNYISTAGRLAQQVMDALEKANIHQPERHNVIVPGTFSSVQQAVALLRRSVDESRKVTLYAGFTACPFLCSFCRYNNRIFSGQTAQIVVDGLVKEIDLRNQNPFPRRNVSSLYLGGGTPALFSNEHLENVLSALGRYHIFGSETEATIETTPEIVTPDLIDRLTSLKPQGVNRWSMGIQWLNDQWLASVGRKHSVGDVLRALGFLSGCTERFNVDLMYGFEGQKPEDLACDINTVLRYNPTEVTLYRLEKEKRTDDRPIRIQRQESEAVYALQAVGRLILQNLGYSEGPDGWFTAPGKSRAVVYIDRWKDQIPMIAYGPEAYSFSKTTQFTNSGFRDWSHALAEGHSPVDATRSYCYDLKQAYHRMMAFKLRSTFECPVVMEGEFFEQLQEAGFGDVDRDTFKLNEIGIMAVQEIVRQLIS